MEKVELNQVAYEAYAKELEWLDSEGRPMSPWYQVSIDQKKAWQASVVAIVEASGPKATHLDPSLSNLTQYQQERKR